MSETSKKRYPIYDYARVFAAFLVILGHCTSVGTDNYMRNCIYAFHMPFFIMVSGMLHKDMGYIPIKKYIRTLIVPYIFANLLLLLLAPLCWKAGWWVGPYDTSMSYPAIYKDYTITTAINFVKGLAMPNGPTWFILTLFWCKLLIDFINRNKWFALLFVAGFAFILVKPNSVLCIGKAMMVFPFFWAGFHYKQAIIKLTESKWSPIAGACLIVLSLLLTWVNGTVSFNGIRFGNCVFPANVTVCYLNAFLGSIGLLLLCSTFKERKVITTCANALISILCLQALFYYTFNNFCDRYNAILCIAASVVILLLCVLLHRYIDKYMPFVLGKTKTK